MDVCKVKHYFLDLLLKKKLLKFSTCYPDAENLPGFFIHTVDTDCCLSAAFSHDSFFRTINKTIQEFGGFTSREIRNIRVPQ